MRWRLVIILWSLFCSTIFAATVQENHTNESTCVLVECFYNFGCQKCREVYESISPLLKENFANHIALKTYDLLKRSDYERFYVLQRKLNVPFNQDIYVFFDETSYIAGKDAVLQNLLPHLDLLIAQKINLHNQGLVYSNASGTSSAGSFSNISFNVNNVSSLNVITVAGAGLLDGFNPCAFSTMVFLITLLSVSGKQRKFLFVAGLGFCLAVFLIYFVIGLGLLQILHHLALYSFFSKLLNYFVAILVTIFALFSFKDAILFKMYGTAEAITLKMPSVMLKKMHDYMRKLFTQKWIFFASFLAGCIVTIFESACTGQLYFPMLVYMISTEGMRTKYLMLLFLYNFMFLIPHIAVFAGIYMGLSNEALLIWSRSNVVISKVLMGCFFLALALLVIK